MCTNSATPSLGTRSRAQNASQPRSKRKQFRNKGRYGLYWRAVSRGVKPIEAPRGLLEDARGVGCGVRHLLGILEDLGDGEEQKPRERDRDRAAWEAESRQPDRRGWRAAAAEARGGGPRPARQWDGGREAEGERPSELDHEREENEQDERGEAVGHGAEEMPSHLQPWRNAGGATLVVQRW